MDVDGSVAFVTGGASGLGEATARVLAAAGASVVLFDKNAERGTEVAGEIGSQARFVDGDVTSEESVQAGLDAAAEMGPLRIAVNCAGSGMAGRTVNRDGSPHDLSVFEWVIRLNLIGTFNVCRLAASRMSALDPVDADGQRGVIVNTASIAAFDGQIGQVAYSASKGGVVGMMLPMARDLAAIGVRVMTIAPGSFDTPIFGFASDEMKTALTSIVPFPTRMGDPAEFGRLVRHFVENDYHTGDVVRIDGAVRFPPK
jgi:NAD(P)-dependent dehydrogenase (short-subunit alcohol dehydrogenase family)